MKVITELENYTDYLKDESLLTGQADKLVFCHSTDDVLELVNNCYSNNIPMTIQGGLTGICGGGVPDGGTIINLSKMNKIIDMSYNKDKDYYTIKVEAGVLLKDLNDIITSKNINISDWDTEAIRVYKKFKKESAKMFPTDPTETLASIGGMVACDASGACSYAYGSVRAFVESICVITPSKKINIRRGQYKYLDLAKVFDIEIKTLPSWHEHCNQLKDVVGLFYQEEMDLIDLFIGAEGILGVITEVELRLINKPEIIFGIMLFMNKDNRMTDFVKWLRESGLQNLCAIEYFDQKTFELLNLFREDKMEIKALPLISTDYDGGIYLEFHLESDEQLDEIMEQLWNQMDVFGINKEEQWLGLEASDYNKLKKIRHAVPECINILIARRKLMDVRLHKIGTDMAVLNKDLNEVLNMYKEEIQEENYEGIIFGHIGNNHLHVNLIPDSYKQYQVAKETVIKWAKHVVKLNGSIAAEHGIGKLKNPLLKYMLSEQDLIEMKKVKSLLETKGIINSGVIF